MEKAFVFDFDDTLAKTTCKINVYERHTPNDKLVAKITPQEFNSYRLGDFEYFNFDEFRNSEFIRTAKPTFLIDLAKEVHAEGHRVYILTARENDVSDSINLWLSEYNIKTKTVFCVGGDKESIAKNKRKVLLSIMESYDKIYYYDDCERNIDLAPTGKKIKKYKV